MAKHLSFLTEKGLIIFVNKVKIVQDGWIVINAGINKLLHNVIGAFFDPSVSSPIANAGGAMTLSRFETLFSTLGMSSIVILQYLSQADLCYELMELSEAQPSLIIPALISCSKPNDIQFSKYCFGLFMSPKLSAPLSSPSHCSVAIKVLHKENH